MSPTPPLRILMLATCLALAACAGDEPAAGGPGRGPGGGDSAVPVTTAPVRMQDFSEMLAATGTVQARESVTVTAKVSETVQQVHFESGQQVARGAPLVTLSGQQQQAALVAAQATANEAERLYQRNVQLAEQQLIARASLDTQRATRDAARAQVAQIRANLADRVVRAPFAGVLGIRQVSPGALVTPGTPIATLDDIVRVYVDFPLPETQLAQVERGQTLTGRVAAWPDMRFDGTVRTIDARIDPATRAATVRADFPNPDGRLRPGMLVNVDLVHAQRRALLVPEIAVVQVGRDSFVYRVKADETVEQAPVKVGARSNGNAEITEGLAEGERIVVDGVGKLRAGLKITEATAPGQAPQGATPPAGGGS